MLLFGLPLGKNSAVSLPFSEENSAGAHSHDKTYHFLYIQTKKRNNKLFVVLKRQ